MEESHADHAGHADEVEEEHAHGFPLPFVLFVVGFLMMLLMDQVLFKHAECSTEANELSSKVESKENSL